MRIDTLSYSNSQTQGVQRREWLRLHAPQHVQQCTALMLHALQQRDSATSRSTVVLGAGACTEIPLAALVRASDEVVLADLDLVAMQRGRDELALPALRQRVRLVQDDLSGGVSSNLNRLIKQQDWDKLASGSPQTFFDALALCLENCSVPDPPELPQLFVAEFGVVISSLLVSQLFSYPILDLLDLVQRVAPAFQGEQERHHRYQEAAQAFRIRIIKAHLHLLRSLLDVGGVAVLLSDVRGFAFNVYGTDHDAKHHRSIPLVPHLFFGLVAETFTVIEEARWEWLTDLPVKERLGRGYEVVGYLLKA
ncbi:MAG TPA: hypothetical protein VFU49_23225 [Ktedonobacteraceae bacterium]|nr:hypothetical protein [Ktedonobacteraceae bacterium]